MSDNLRIGIYRRDKGICWVCNAEVDYDSYDLGHIIDRCNGGEFEANNLAVMHHKCNLSKPRHKTIEEAIKWQLSNRSLINSNLFTQNNSIVNNVPELPMKPQYNPNAFKKNPKVEITEPINTELKRYRKVGEIPRRGGKVQRYMDTSTGKTFYMPSDYKRGKYKNVSEYNYETDKLYPMEHVKLDGDTYIPKDEYESLSEELPTKICPKCQTSDKIYKYGKRTKWSKGKKQYLQAYLCDNCGYQWRILP
jgi:ssDNA-binding Zn-finger/Zn-ribbon topoisomerase 1